MSVNIHSSLSSISNSAEHSGHVVLPDLDCMFSKGFGQAGHKNKRGFQVPNTFF
jgi:hypothetical protein